MLALKHNTKKLMGALLGALFFASVGQATPQRVVSVNLCTDQLAMLLAGEGQLISVSHLALDPHMSSMGDEARHYSINHGHAEEVFMLDPDLVLVGPYTDINLITMLKTVGLRVEKISVAHRIEDVPLLLRETGALLGQIAKAEDMARDFELRIDKLKENSRKTPAKRAAIYAANGYSVGPKTLAGDILRLAGVYNIAQDYGLDYGGGLPLEELVMAKPELLIFSEPYDGYSRSEEILTHPALKKLIELGQETEMDNRWVCALPFLLDAAEELQKLVQR